MRIPFGTQLASRPPVAMPPLACIPAPEMPFPAASGSVLAPVPQTFPGSSLTYEAFLYSQLQNSVQPGTANTWTAAQTISMPFNTSGLNFVSSSTAPQNKKVVTTWANTWQVGANSSGDGVDVDFFWGDIINGVVRMRIDTDGQLTLPGFASTNGVSYNNAVNNSLCLEARPLTGNPVGGFGVGTLYRLPDSNGLLIDIGAINHVLDAVTPGAQTTHYDFYATQAGTLKKPLVLNPASALLTAQDANTAALSTILTLKHESGAASAGAGLTTLWQGRDGSNNLVSMGQEAIAWTSATAGAASSALAWTIRMTGTEIEPLRLRAVGMSPTARASVSGFVGGQVFCQADFLHGGNSLGFFNVGPIAQQTGGALVAGGSYGANEEVMLNRLWSAVRGYGLID